jgi:hypothetical protein
MRHPLSGERCMSHPIAPRFSRFGFQHAVVIPVFMLATALAAKCGGDASASTPDVASGGPSSQAAAAVGGSSGTSPIDPKKFCAALLPQVKALIKAPLAVLSADDSHSDATHTGEPGYVSCVNGSGGYRATIIMSDDPDKAFTSQLQPHYQALPGFGDVARSSQGGIQWVDVMKGKTFCEAIVTIDDKDIVAGDWKTTGGKMCMAAFALR